MDIPAVGLDVDGVLANTYPGILTRLGLDPAQLTTYPFADSFGQEAARDIHAAFERPDTWVSAPVMPGAVEAISLLRQAGVFPVFISSIPERFTSLRHWWLEHHFGEQLGRCPVYLKVVPHNQKVPAAIEYDLTHFVEDRRDTANAMAAAGLTSILVPSTYHNDGPIDPRVSVQPLLDFATAINVAVRQKVAA